MSMWNLEVSALGLEPVLDVAFGISGEAEHEVPLDLQLVDGLDGLMDLENRNTRFKPLNQKSQPSPPLT